MLDPKSLDQETQDRLVRVLHKSDAELRDDEREFLRARGAYVKDKHKANFPSVFGKDAEKQAEKARKEAEKKAQEDANKPEEEKEEVKEDEDIKPDNPFEDDEDEDEDDLPG